jgi:ABC-type multidrug transport system fused ATPase/permease subunit
MWKHLTGMAQIQCTPLSLTGLGPISLLPSKIYHFLSCQEQNWEYVAGAEGSYSAFGSSLADPNDLTSGKSSIFLAILRLLDLKSGMITIDGLDISRVPAHFLRSRLTSLPQQPYLMPGSIRQNMDSTGRASDETIKAALNKVGLQHLLSTTTLDAVVDWEILSQGQRQLFCLARALVSRCSILILDEATSDLDKENEQLIQRLIRDEFGHCTVIAIAHHLETIRDFDRVIVMEEGRIVEEGCPSDLLLQDGSKFAALYSNREV